MPADGTLRLSPVTADRALAGRWLAELGAGGLDGVVAKRADAAYASGERTAMRKVKRMRTVDCVVGGFRYAQTGGEIGSLAPGSAADLTGFELRAGGWLLPDGAGQSEVVETLVVPRLVVRAGQVHRLDPAEPVEPVVRGAVP